MILDHVNLRTADPERSIAFYQLLGLEVVGHLDMGDLYNLYLGVDGRHLVELTANRAADAGWSTAAGSGHLALAVGDLDKLLADLARQGIQPERGPLHPAGREEWRVCFLLDPDGNLVELIEGERMSTPGDPLPTDLS